MSLFFRYAIGLLALALCASAPAVQAQDPAVIGDVFDEAVALHAAGDYQAAAQLLGPLVDAHPEHEEAFLVLGESLYWAGYPARARDRYEQSLVHHPAGVRLRLAYGAMLVDLGDAERARAVLEPVGDDPMAGRLLGTLAYWEGDLTSAARHFRRTLAEDPTDEQAAHLLGEITAHSSPWVRATGGLVSDTQPLVSYRGTVEAGIYLTPLQALSLHVTPRSFTVQDSVRHVHSAGLTYRAFWPDLGIDTELAAGVVNRTYEDGVSWTGRLALAARLPHHLQAGVTLERAPYLYTEASLFEPVHTDMVQARIDYGPHDGWIGQAAFQIDRFPDDNLRRTAYTWLLAPLVNRADVGAQIGYAFSYAHADSSRFVPVRVLPSTPGPGQPTTYRGIYSPYHTPNNLTTHSATAAVRIAPHRAVELNASGSFGVWAREMAPFFYTAVPGGPPIFDFYEHQFNPWSVRGSLAYTVIPALSLRFEASHSKTSFYDATNLELSLLYRLPFGPLID